MAKVPFTPETTKKCVCPQCPVQTPSQCSAGKMEKMKTMMEQDQNMMPKADDVAGTYCGTGVASCDDINTEQMCICGNCPLWTEYDLPSGKPMGYYCKDGEAQEKTE